MITQYISLQLILFFRSHCSVYEIYPQSETPHITLIAHLGLDPSNDPQVHLLPDTLIWFGFNEDRDHIVFRVWDYRLNHSISFTVDVSDSDYDSGFRVYFNLSKVPKFFSNPFVLVDNGDEDRCHRPTCRSFDLGHSTSVT